ncbi:DUF1476 domain-containing protein [uncultured Methylobacterium sp.]|jgi:hypothetical protein|uniref:DUF1476 domain-containing protein n=1 Tax=uncultured Methylobacterium sp. TaxID=157278 RepID=UPI0026233054|nr:DUF1476 domain-containing protein [uncultured Methylobacterium sp.]
MTTLFEEQERAYETLFAREEALRFVALARRNKLVGAWMCEQIGLTGARAEGYCRSLVADGVGRASDAALLDRLRTDLAAAGAADRMHDLPGVLARCAARAAAEVRGASA